MGDALSLLRVMRAARELAQSASHLANVAAETAPSSAARLPAQEAALATARAAFRLDDCLRGEPDDDWLPAALDALDVSAAAIRTAREALSERAAPVGA